MATISRYSQNAHSKTILKLAVKFRLGQFGVLRSPSDYERAINRFNQLVIGNNVVYIANKLPETGLRHSNYNVSPRITDRVDYIAFHYNNVCHYISSQKVRNAVSMNELNLLTAPNTGKFIEVTTEWLLNNAEKTITI